MVRTGRAGGLREFAARGRESVLLTEAERGFCRRLHELKGMMV